MHYFMGLYDRPFELMASGEKTVEVRLFDKKRRQLAVGDLITFSKLTNRLEDMTVQVKNLTRFATFREMYETIPAGDMGASGSTLEDMLEQTALIYPPEKEEKWGMLAIEVEKVKKRLN